MSDKPLVCVGVPMNGVDKHDFQAFTGKIKASLVNPPADPLASTESPRKLAEDLAALLTAERERNAALQAKLDTIRSALIPVAEQDWHGKWRVNRAIELARE